MKLFYFLLLLILSSNLHAQKFAGKWYGKLTQGPGGFKDVYEFELNINSDSSMSGISYAYIPGQLEIEIGFNGYIKGDSIVIQERENLLQNEDVPLGWEACIKTITVARLRLEDKDFLRGTWNGKNKTDGSSCVSGLTILARDKKDLKSFIDTRKGRTTLSKATTISTSSDRTGESTFAKKTLAFNPDFRSGPVSNMKEIEVDSANLYIVLDDYDKIDDDTVSVYLNRDMLVERARINKDPLIINFQLDKTIKLNELLLFAENNGNISPNTAKMLLVDGLKKHIILIESDKHRSAAVYLKLKEQMEVSKKQKGP